MKFTRLSRHIGADVHDIDVSRPMTDAQVEEVRQGLIDHLVLFFREQPVLTIEQHKALANNFGDLETTTYRRTSLDEKVQVVEGGLQPGEAPSTRPPFHADGTFKEAPAMGSFLQAHILPQAGGDTCFASTYAAYEALSPAMQTFLEGLHAYHSLSFMNRRHIGKPGYELRLSPDENPPLRSPVIRVHPDTGRKFLNVNSIYTSHIDDLREDESELLLAFLFNHVMRPEFQVRMHWNVGDIAFWDNWSTQHCGVYDFDTHRRLHRVSILRRANEQAERRVA